MRLSKKDLPNFMALGVAAVVVGAGIATGYAWAPREPSAPVSPPPAISSTSDRQPPALAKHPATQPAAVETVESAEAAPAPETVSARPDPKPRVAAAPPRRRPQPPISSTAVPRGALPPLLPPLGVPPAGASTPLPRPDVLRLAGVIKGEDAKLALLRRGDKRYLVREGDLVEGVYRVTKITDSTVVLRRRSRTETLRLSQA